MLETDVLVIIPARNEERTIRSVVETLRRDTGFDVLVVDDASSDGTASQALAGGAVVLPLRLHLGAWGAIQTGFRYAIRKGYAVGLTMDADGQHPPQEAGPLMEAWRVTRPDLMIGSCTGRAGALRRLAWWTFRAITGLSISDLTSGFRVYSRRSMKLLLDPAAQLLDFQDVGVLLYLTRHGLSIEEAHTTMCEREHGTSRVYGSRLKIGRYMTETIILCLSKRQHQ